MDDDKTVIRIPSHRQPEQELDADRTVVRPSGVLFVGLIAAAGEAAQTFSFSTTFTVGRALDNAIVVDNALVSRHHLEVRREDGAWWAVNLQSRNGVTVAGTLVHDKARLSFPTIIALVGSGVTLTLDTVAESRSGEQVHGHGPDTGAPAGSKPDQSPPRQGETVNLRVSPYQATDGTGTHSSVHLRDLAPEEIKARLLAETEAADSGDYTRFVRRLIREDRTVRTKSYKKAIWVLAGLFAVSIGLATYQHIALGNARKLALDMFYDIKALEVSLAQADTRLEESSDTLGTTLEAIANEQMRISQDKLKAEQEKLAAERKRMLAERQRLASMKAKYRQYVDEVNALRLRFPTAAQYEEELIARVARELGESELELPDGFVAEVRKYIRYWQGSSRMQEAMANAEKGGYLSIVIAALKKQGLPVYFLYLPLQESNYDVQAMGPETRFGIAKGAWQLLATTAHDFGIQPGPLVNVREYDALDGRFDFALATQAGTKYLKRIYSTEAQASGLLVMASYNYGDTRVREMIRQMPDNPRDKNFWKFIQQYELPRETHDYVFYIFAAAVIGDDPQHFGFKFAPPLINAESGDEG